jgi:hypothetical protein
VTSLRQRLADYLSLRRRFGYALTNAGHWLSHFVDYCEERGADVITVDPDCEWDMEQVLDFTDSARLYLDEHPIVEIEHDGQLTVIVRSFVDEWQDVNSPPIESVYRPNTDAELDVLDAGIEANIAAGRVIE